MEMQGQVNLRFAIKIKKLEPKLQFARDWVEPDDYLSACAGVNELKVQVGLLVMFQVAE
jgi:hypothetical protein